MSGSGDESDEDYSSVMHNVSYSVKIILKNGFNLLIFDVGSKSFCFKSFSSTTC
jgi:hypothetical protein